MKYLLIHIFLSIFKCLVKSLLMRQNSLMKVDDVFISLLIKFLKGDLNCDKKINKHLCKNVVTCKQYVLIAKREFSVKTDRFANKRQIFAFIIWYIHLLKRRTKQPAGQCFHLCTFSYAEILFWDKVRLTEYILKRPCA